MKQKSKFKFAKPYYWVKFDCWFLFLVKRYFLIKFFKNFIKQLIKFIGVSISSNIRLLKFYYFQILNLDYNNLDIVLHYKYIIIWKLISYFLMLIFVITLIIFFIIYFFIMYKIFLYTCKNLKNFLSILKF